MITLRSVSCSNQSQHKIEVELTRLPEQDDTRRKKAIKSSGARKKIERDEKERDKPARERETVLHWCY